MSVLQDVMTAARGAVRRALALRDSGGERSGAGRVALRDSDGERPAAGRVILPRREDSVRDYPSVGLTPSKLAGILREADEGSLESAMHLFEQMEEKDAHLYSVANTRRLALTGLEWTIVADVGRGSRGRSTGDARLAAEAAAHCREALARVEGFDDALQHLSLATGRNLAICELVWEAGAEGLRLADVAPVDFTRIVFDAFDVPRILTEEAPREGIEAARGKFVVHTPQNKSGHPQRGGLLRVSALVYLAKQLALKDWMVFAEIFGMPVRIARYDPSATAEEKRELLHMLEALASHAAGIFSRGVELEVIEANRGTIGPPFERLIDFLNREMSKAWLGQTLTTETTGAAGTLAASAVHDQVRQDLRADDIRKEAQTIRRDVLGPLTRFRFGDAAPVPHFVRRPGRPRDISELTNVLDVAINRLGVRAPRAWVHETLGIPESQEKEAVLERVASRGGDPI
ncbi:MAG: hypothetical protein FLDDKLPJ_01668 [Phycisphaerae bacterium]|nr:hypothetical protein [Phycisphaerae bacterium]